MNWVFQVQSNSNYDMILENRSEKKYECSVVSLHVAGFPYQLLLFTPLLTSVRQHLKYNKLHHCRMLNSGLIFHRHTNDKRYVCKISKHRCNLATNIGGTETTTVLETSIYEGVKLERGGNWLQPVLNIVHTFSSGSPNFFVAPLQLSITKKYS
jgi:hypothetical protein